MSNGDLKQPQAPAAAASAQQQPAAPLPVVRQQDRDVVQQQDREAEQPAWAAPSRSKLPAGGAAPPAEGALPKIAPGTPSPVAAGVVEAAPAAVAACEATLCMHMHEVQP